MPRSLAKSLFIAAASALVLAQAAAAAQFSADFVQKIGGRSTTGKVYVQGDKIRREATRGAEQTIVISRMDKRIVWMLHPAQKSYMEMSFEKNRPYILNDPKWQQELKKLGTLTRDGQETVNGYPCDKYVLVYRDKAMGTQYQWISKKLKFPIKIETKGSRFPMVIEYKNIKERRLADSLFEVPAGYKKMSMQQMPGMPMGKGMAHPR
jgi:outer membrane lipoprotein-sorting protein